VVVLKLYSVMIVVRNSPQMSFSYLSFSQRKKVTGAVFCSALVLNSSANIDAVQTADFCQVVRIISFKN